MSDNTQIIISGLGGQGVLFITKLLAGAAMAQGLDVKTSETHGMAQRGGNVISYLKIGDFSSPLIRPAKADAMIALKEESFFHHNYFVKPNGLCVVNSTAQPDADHFKVYARDAGTAAVQQGAEQSVNLVMLGLFTAAIKGEGSLITLDSLARVVEEKFKNKAQMIAGILGMLETGYNLYEKE